jgi:tRNA uracil 4-sulfurtransferase
MTYDLIVSHYHEIGLKGRNRGFFEQRLVENIATALSGTGYRSIKNFPGRIVVWLRREHDLKAIVDGLGRVFGLSNFSPAIAVKPEMEALVETSIHLADASSFESFEVRARKTNSVIGESSQRINEIVGQAIKDHTGKRVDLSNPDWSCSIELVGGDAFVSSERYAGPGGLPVGTGGKVVTLLSGGIDSPVAAWEMAKRGATHELIHFHGQPFTDPSSVRQATRLSESLSPWIGRSRLWLVPFGDIQSEIVTSVPQQLRVVLYRRFMMRIAEGLALREGAEGLVTGESLGQVASQTLPNLRAIDAVVKEMPVLRPLIGRDKIEIEAIARRIGTYEISIDPHQDCCVLFVPRQVTTRASVEQLDEVEKDLNVEALTDKGLSGAEPVDIPPASSASSS